MKRTEAEELYGKQVIATQLVDLTNSVADETLNILRVFIHREQPEKLWIC